MQIFSKLQRNSTYKTLIKLVLIFLINSFSALTPLFPVLIGFFLYCEEIFFAVFYIVLFALLHNVNVFYLMSWYFILKFFIEKRIIDYINYEYRGIFYIALIYVFLFFYYVWSVGVKEVFLFLIFNFSFDILLIKVFRCEAKLS
jgi:hypothetical protein